MELSYYLKISSYLKRTPQSTQKILYGFYDVITKKKIIYRVVCRIGGATYAVYLMHMMVVAVLGAVGISDYIRKSFSEIKYGDILYTFVMVALVFAISYILTEVWRFCVKILRRKLQRLKMANYRK